MQKMGEDMKMLCIDGGGIRGVFALAILQSIEEECNTRIGDLFEVVAGTSTGAIIATSVALQIKMKDVLEDYIKYGKRIFIRQAKYGLFKSVYSDRDLRHFIQKAFGELTLGDIQKPLLIPAVDLTHGNPFVHRTNFGCSRTDDDLSIRLWDAVLSSCSAPVYFPPNNINNKYLSIDGGLWANNPSLVCISEAMHDFQVPLSDIRIFSLGTGKQNIDFSIQKKRNWGISHWLPFQFPTMKVTPKLLDLALHLSSESVSYHCKQLLGKNYYRVNEDLECEIPFDEVRYIDRLILLAEEVFESKKREILQFLA